MPKIFFSLSDSTYLTKAQPEPMSAMVMKRRAPFSLCGGTENGEPPAAALPPGSPFLIPHPHGTHRCVM